MQRYDVCLNLSPASKQQIPYLLVLQHPAVDFLHSRVVAPLALPELLNHQTISRLTPKFTIEGQIVVLLTPEIGAVPLKALGPVVGQLSDQASTISAALDLLLNGY